MMTLHWDSIRKLTVIHTDDMSDTWLARDSELSASSENTRWRKVFPPLRFNLKMTCFCKVLLTFHSLREPSFQTMQNKFVMSHANYHLSPTICGLLDSLLVCLLSTGVSGHLEVHLCTNGAQRLRCLDRLGCASPDEIGVHLSRAFGTSF